jgi:hypothetical protein
MAPSLTFRLLGPRDSLAGEIARRSRRFLKRAWRKASRHDAALAGAVLALVAAAGLPDQRAEPRADFPPPAAAESIPAAVWTEIPRPQRLYDLAATPDALAYKARRHATGGGREDMLTFGAFAGPGAYLRLSLYRHGSEPSAEASFFVDMARRAAPLGLGLGRVESPQDQDTKFGDFETAALTLIEGSLTRDNCRGFRFSAANPGLAIAGFACGAGEEPMLGGDFACLINRLTLTSAERDHALRDFFAAAQRRGQSGCPKKKA